MNVDLKRVRESTQDDSSPSKRRATSLTTPADEDSGSNSDSLEGWEQMLEVKRKEAIYRQMLEYRRMHEREQQRANDLEAQKRVLEASVQAVEICWTQLVTAIRTLAGSETIDTESATAAHPSLPSSSDAQDVTQALQKRLPATERLVSRFVDLSAKNGLQPGVKDLHAKCTELQAEASTLRFSTQSLKTQLSDLTASRDTYKRDLMKAQKALDRQRMEHSRAAEETKSREAERRPATPIVAAQNGTNGSGAATPNGNADEDKKPSASELESAEDVVKLEGGLKAAQAQLDALREEHTKLQQDYDDLRISSAHISEEDLRQSPTYRLCVTRLADYQNSMAELERLLKKSQDKTEDMERRNQVFKTAVFSSAEKEAEALRQQVAQKNGELVRIRTARDEVLAELMEKKTTEMEQCRHAEEMEVLAKTREERIVFLVSEVKRLKGCLAARDGSEGYLAFLRGEGGIDGDYVKHLETKSQEAEKRLAEVSPDDQDRGDTAVLQSSLERLQRIIGTDPNMPDDVKALGTRLEHFEAENRKLQLQLEESAETTNALYTEVEGLSKLWEDLSQTMKTKVYDLKDAEQKMSRLATEKAKANNKYFAAMQAKETLEHETRNIQRTAEKQAILLQKKEEVERSLVAQIVSRRTPNPAALADSQTKHEGRLVDFGKSSTELQLAAAKANSEKREMEIRLEQAQASLSTAQQIMKDRVAECATEKTARQKLQEDLEAVQRTNKKLKASQDALMETSKDGLTGKESQLQNENKRLLVSASESGLTETDEKHLLRCSTCQINFRSQVITRCMHTFCRECLDSRIQSRQRKCPHCAISFAKEDVQTLYFQ